MLRGAQAGRSMYLSKAWTGVGDPVFELRLLIAAQRGDLNRKLTIRSRSLPAASARTTPLCDDRAAPRIPPHTTIRPLRAVRRGRIFGGAPGRAGRSALGR
ncbi:hypothetical protein GCM10010521_56890 [Streptomyces rameus]|uniref:Uncharacterized protein n=1 Tax=Streptomyces rameus TaxID=68261 RepID=A0ABN3V2N5_9ACTN